MRLAEWRKQEGYSQQQMAQRLGVSQPVISLAERANDPQLPQPSTVIAIYVLSRGQVQPNDFYDLPPINHPQLPGMERAADAPLLADASQGDQ
jgi:transcriptional regulator with XRE-family HTH domain